MSSIHLRVIAAEVVLLPVLKMLRQTDGLFCGCSMARPLSKSLYVYLLAHIIVIKVLPFLPALRSWCTACRDSTSYCSAAHARALRRSSHTFCAVSRADGHELSRCSGKIRCKPWNAVVARRPVSLAWSQNTPKAENLPEIRKNSKKFWNLLTTADTAQKIFSKKQEFRPKIGWPSGDRWYIYTYKNE